MPLESDILTAIGCVGFCSRCENLGMVVDIGECKIRKVVDSAHSAKKVVSGVAAPWKIFIIVG